PKHYWNINEINRTLKPGGVALNKSAEVLLDLNEITGGTYDEATGQVIIFGKEDSSPTALPPMDIDDLSVAFQAVSKGSMPVVSIEDPVVSSPPEWPGRDAFTVRYGPFQNNPETGEREVLDLSSKTHFGWVMFEADRLMKSLGLGIDNRTGETVSSDVLGYYNLLDLTFRTSSPDNVTTRFWFHPKDIVIAPSSDGNSMEFQNVEVQLSTETMFASNGQVQSTLDAEYFVQHFTEHYDEIAAEQISYDDEGNPHYIFKELKQLAALVGVVQWIKDSNIPIDLSSVESHTPLFYDSAPGYTPQTTVSDTRSTGFSTRTVTIKGGVNYCTDLYVGSGGSSGGIADTAQNTRPAETEFSWSFTEDGQAYNAAALSLEKKEKSGGFSQTVTDVSLQVNGTTPLTLSRFYDSFDVEPTLFGWGWHGQPYFIELRGERSQFNLCAQEWDGYSKIWFHDRAGQAVFDFSASGIYNRESDPLGLSSRFVEEEDILVYRYRDKDTPGLIFSDNTSKMVVRFSDSTLVEFSLDGNLHLIEDRNGNKIEYSYDSMKQLTAIEQPGGRAIALMYNSANQVTDASLPDGHSVHYTYDSSDNLISAQYDAPFGRLVRYVYDSEHRLSEIQDENSESTASWQYDVYGRVTETVQPGGTTPFQTNYNLTAGTTTQIGPNATSQNTVNNEDGDPTKITDSLGNETIMNYNSNRDLITVLSADNKTLQYYYDERGNTIATVYPNGRADMVLFDSDSNPAAKFHSFFNSNFFNSFSIEHILTDTVFDMHTAGFTDYDYDLNGNLISVTDALDNEKTFGYDVRGNMIWAKDSNNNQHNFTYDDYGRMITQRNPLNHYTTYTYDDTDNVTQVETPAGAANFTYNEKNELESVTKGDPGNRQTTSYLYNTKGQLIQVTNPVGIITEYQYDDRGNLTQVMHDNIARFAYQYNELNQLTETSYSGTSGGGEASIIITTPVGSEELHNNINISWQVSGNWGEGNRDITIQYSTDGTAWHDIATVNIDDGIYAWNTGTLSSNDVWIRFLRPGDNNFSIPTTPPFIVSNGTEYYVNDDTTNGDQYSTAAGQPYNGTTVTGRSPVDPVNQIQDIIEYNDLEPGDTIYVDAGNYSITSEIVFTEDDSGSEDKPILLTGPTNGEHAVIQQINPLPSCLRIQDMSPEVGHAGGGIIIQNLELSGAETGVLLLDAQYCLIQNNDIHDNGINYSSGLENKGIGIQIAGGGFNTIESNRSYNNGAIGPSGANPGENGGAGRGFGIMVFSSNFNLVRNNECYNNGGTGGTPGSDNDMAGFSEGVGILVENGTGNHILHNTSYNNDVNGVSSENARGGNGQSFGIVLLETTDSTIERNIVYNNDAVGGNSTGSSGGWGWSVGIYGQGENNLTVLSNSSFFNTAKGGYSGTASTDYLGDGDASGILLQNCPGSLVKNNLSHNNSSFAWDVIGNEYYGIAYAYGIGLISSSDCELYNNTCYRNWAKINGYASDTILTGQIYAGFSSTGTRIKNNTMALSNPFSNGIFVSTSSQTDLISDNNNIHKVGTTNKIGVWGATTCETMLDWQQVSGQDVNSYSVDPLFYDAEENNFHLSSQSPLIDQGISLTDVQSDGDGETRPIDGPDEDSIASYDIGYDEFVDSDSDGLANIIELELTGTDPYTADTDQDGLPDGWEVENGLSPLDETSDNGADGDPDNDGYTNSMEFRNGSSPNNDGSLPQVGPQITSALPVSLNQFIQEEDSILFSVTASDNNGDEISYSWLLDGTEQATTSSWAFATTDISSGSTSLSKEYVVQLIIEAGGDHVTREWAVMVVNRNHTPVLELINNIAVLAGDTVSISPVFSDQDNQNLVDGDNNIVSIQYSGWMTDPVRVTGSGDIGNHLVTVTVTDDGSPALNTYQVVEVNVLGSRIDFYKLDDDLDGSDLAEFGQAYISGNNAADINDDNTVDSDDINNFAEHFGR
ncbi:MAG: hypothetical protein GY702_09200, partial [Desulfobulbaceae bacterium]|nr:hypothetical protein [Desulfobulbaceae bacterium]